MGLGSMATFTPGAGTNDKTADGIGFSVADLPTPLALALPAADAMPLAVAAPCPSEVPTPDAEALV